MYKISIIKFQLMSQLLKMNVEYSTLILLTNIVGLTHFDLISMTLSSSYYHMKKKKKKLLSVFNVRK
jgi:hypothetical protein